MDSPWTIEILQNANEIDKLLKSKNKIAAKSLAKELELLQLLGNALKLPHSRALGGGLFELRERNFGYRVYYTFYGDKVILLLTAGDKATQEKDIKVARKRLELFLKQRAKE